MARRIFLSLALAAVSSLVLSAAAPAYACGPDCDCAKKQSAPKTDKKPVDAKPSDKDAKPVPEKKATLAPAAAQGAALAADEGCKCEKGGKNCTCKKGACKCANCGQGAKEEKGGEGKAKA